MSRDLPIAYATRRNVRRPLPFRGRPIELLAWVRSDGRPLLAPAVLLWVISVLLADVLKWAGGDVLVYKAYAQAAFHVPILHHLPQEYPAPALAIFVLPLVFSLAYPWIFAVLVGVGLVGLLAAYRLSDQASLDIVSARRLVVYLTVGSVVVLTARYDLFAAACGFLAFRAARRESWAAAWTWSSVGFLLKLFPAVLWPVFLIAEFRRTRRVPKTRMLWIAGSTALLIVVPAIFNPAALFNEVHYYLHRPPTVEGLASGLSLLFDWHAWHFIHGYGSVNAVSPLVGPMAVGVTLLAAAGIIATLWAQAKSRITLDVACLLSLTLVVLGMKVVSAQYLLWLMPFWALYKVRGPWVLACVANTIVFFFSESVAYLGYLSSHTWATTLTLMFLFRDVLIAVGTINWLRSELTTESTLNDQPESHMTVEPALAEIGRDARGPRLLQLQTRLGT